MTSGGGYGGEQPNGSAAQKETLDKPLNRKPLSEGDHATHSRVANSTSSTPFQGQRRWISSVLYSPDGLDQRVVVRIPGAPEQRRSDRQHRAGSPRGDEPSGPTRQPLLVRPLLRYGSDASREFWAQAWQRLKEARRHPRQTLYSAGDSQHGRRRPLLLRPVQTGERLSLYMIAGGAPSHHRALQPLTKGLGVLLGQ
jgi:hypothetical protein